MRIVITGIGFRSAFGNLDRTWQGIIEGRSSIQLIQPFAELPLLPLALIDTQPQQVLDLTRIVVAEAIEDAGLSLPLPECGVTIGSSRSCQSDWEKLTKKKGFQAAPFKGNHSKILPNYQLRPFKTQPIQNPKSKIQNRVTANLSGEPDLTNWLNTLPQSPAIETARYIGSRSALLAPMAACATGIWSLAQAVGLIRSGACERAIAGAVEAPITPLTIAGFSRMGALATTGCYPFDRYREGLVLGEAGAVFILETATLAAARGARIYGEVLGFGLTNDAAGMYAMNTEGTAGYRAICQCLDRSQLLPKDIDYIHAHGTSTPLNDRFESQLITQIFPDGVAVSSTKGATGHTLGASGAVGVALCLQAISTQTLPPCVGLTDPDFDLDLVRIARSTQVKALLCLSFGFGGQNTAIALGKFTP